jgi:hypothetical protein
MLLLWGSRRGGGSLAITSDFASEKAKISEKIAKIM